MTDFTKFHNIIDTLILLNLDARQKYAQVKEKISHRQWVEEHCIVSCDIGRATGKTEYIKRRVKQHDLICTFDTKTRDDLFKQVNCNVLAAQQIKYGVQNKKFNTIFVDEPALVFQEIERNIFFDKLIHNGEQTFIMLGSTIEY